MNLQHLCSAPHVTIYFDSWNNWLYVEWAGDVTLPAVQCACLEVAQCFVKHAYSRVLNNDSLVTSVSWDVAPWLAKHFLPGLEVAGVEQLAWVYAPTIRGRLLAELTAHQLSHLTISLFSDIEEATSWLQRLHPAYISNCILLPRPVAAEAELTQVVENFKHALDYIGVNAELVAVS